ncbi:hypothetical protein Tco_1408632 [Tanacetum coccineum]
MHGQSNCAGLRVVSWQAESGCSSEEAGSCDELAGLLIATVARTEGRKTRTGEFGLETCGVDTPELACSKKVPLLIACGLREVGRFGVYFRSRINARGTSLCSSATCNEGLARVEMIFNADYLEAILSTKKLPRGFREAEDVNGICCVRG